MPTHIFLYENLTWPEVESLPRDTPLVLPLGVGYPVDSLAGLLGRPANIGLLPALPFGWEGSGLAVPADLLRTLLSNLVDSLREQGFSRLYLLSPAETGLNLGDNQIVLPRIPAEPKLLSGEDRDKVVILPIGHTEQHGLHLPLSTDTLIVEAIARGIARLVPDQAISLPAMPYGVSTHRASFPATLNAGGRAFEDFWLGVIATLVAQGYNRFYLISGHGGNVSFLVNVVKYAGEHHRRIFCATAWLYLSGPDGIQALEERRRSPTGGMGHACELETSLILHLRPELVQMERAVDELDFIATRSYYMDWVEGGALIANPPWDDDTRTGAYGAGSLATAENGRYWLDAAVAEKVAHVAEIHEQHRRREERRKGGYGRWGKISILNDRYDTGSHTDSPRPDTGPAPSGRSPGR